MGLPEHLTCFLRNLYVGQETKIRTGHGVTDLFWIENRVGQGCLLSPCLFNLDVEYIMRNAGLEEAQTGIKIVGRNINNLRYADDTTLIGESKEELKSLFMKVKEESEKVGLKLNIQETKIMASGPITSWQIDGETMETERLFLGGSNITADGDCRHEIRRHLPLGGKAMTNLDRILRSRDVTNKGSHSQTYHFSSSHVSVQFSSVQSLTFVWLFGTPWTASMPALPVHHQLPQYTQTHVHLVSDAIQPSHHLSSPSPSAFNLSQHQGLFQWVSSLHQVAKVLEFQLHHQYFQWIFRTDFL